MPEIRSVEINRRTWFVLMDVLVSVGKLRAMSNPMFVARIPEEQRQQVRMSGRWTWLVTQEGADAAVGQDWREHGDPRAIGRDRAAGRAHAHHAKEMQDRPRHEPALFLQIASDLRKKIQSGELQPGRDLPARMALAGQWGCSVPTASRALRLLRREGLVASRVGRNGGYRVVGMPDA